MLEKDLIVQVETSLYLSSDGTNKRIFLNGCPVLDAVTLRNLSTIALRIKSLVTYVVSL